MRTREQVIEEAERLRRLTPDQIEHYELPPVPSEDEVRAKVADYQARVEALFQEIEGWVAADGRYATRRGDSLFLYEPPMALYDLDDAEVPTLSVFTSDGVEVLRFRPDKAWVTLTNGRVSIDAPNVPLKRRPHNLRLLDNADPLAPANWTLWGTRPDQIGDEPFDHNTLLRIVEESHGAI